MRHHWGCTWLPSLGDVFMILLLFRDIFFRILAILICFAVGPNISLYVIPLVYTRDYPCTLKKMLRSILLLTDST